MVADFLWRHGEGQRSRFLTDHPLYHHQSYWCQYRYSAPAPLEPWLRERERDGGGGWENIVKDLSENSVSCLSACVCERESLTVKGSVCVAHKADTVLKGGVACMICQAGRCLLTTYCAHTHSRSLTHPKHSLPLKRMCRARCENMCQTSNGDGLHSNSPQSNENWQRCWIFVL